VKSRPSGRARPVKDTVRDGTPQVTAPADTRAQDNTGVDVRNDGWDIRARWFGVVVGATPRTGELPRGETIPWRVIAAQIAPREHRGSR
jgi:hypothetical protein